ncbi:MAG TPA: ABC transporter permease [Actinocatenispora sp.]
MTQTPAGPHDFAEAPAGGLAVGEAPLGEPGEEVAAPSGTAIIGRSPGQLAWIRLKRDRVALVSGIVLLIMFVLAIAAPLISKLYGSNATDQHSDLLDTSGYPLGYLGGISGSHWLGLEPQLGRDVLMQLIYGMRTSLVIAFVSAIITVAVGIIIGIIAGYAGGIVDSVLNWIIDLVLAFPFFIFCLAAIPVVTDAVYGSRGDVSALFRVGLIIAVFACFSWTYPARLVRGQVLSLREREFVEAARAAGAGMGHILFRQLLPNIWAPILVVFSLNVPSFITGEAALSFLNIGVVEPTPDLGRMINNGTSFLQTDPFYTMVSGATILILVLAFNLFGDSVRDALDPKSSR